MLGIHRRPRSSGRGEPVLVDRPPVPRVQRLDADDQGWGHELPVPLQRPLCGVLVLELQVQEVGLGLAEGAPLEDITTLAELLSQVWGATG